MQRSSHRDEASEDRVGTSSSCSGQGRAGNLQLDDDPSGERVNGRYITSNDSDQYVSDDGLDDYTDSGVTSLGVSYSEAELIDYTAAACSRRFIIGCNSSSDLSEASDRDEPTNGPEGRADQEEVMLLPISGGRDPGASEGSASGSDGRSSLAEEYQRVEQWLDSHQDFVLDYFTRKPPLTRLKDYTQGVNLESPLISPVYGALGAAVLGGIDPIAIPSGATAGSSSTSRASSGANTPVRKISAQEFERNGQLLARMVQTVDGIPSFLSATSEPRSESGPVASSSSSSLKRRRSLSELKALDEHQLMHELIRDICNDLDVTRLCHKILKNLSFLLGADRCSLFLVQQSVQSTDHYTGQCGQSTDHYSGQCGQSIGHSCQDDESTGKCGECSGSSDHRCQCCESVGYSGRPTSGQCSESARHSGQYNESSCTNDLCSESTDQTGQCSESKGQTAQCSGSTGQTGQCNWSTGNISQCSEPAGRTDLYAGSTGNSGQYSDSVDNIGQCGRRRSRQYASSGQSRPDELHVPRADSGQSDRTGQYDRYLVSTLFDVGMTTSLQEGMKMSQEIRIPIGTGIVGHVALTGESLNIADAYEDKRFNKEVDRLTGYKTRSILCMPVLDSNGQVIAVAQAINKSSVKYEPFSEQDEKVFKSYLAFCGIGIHNAQMYERSTLENRRNQLMLDLAWVIFEEQSNVATLINKILLHTLSLLRCERCQLLLVDESNPSKFSQAFDIQASDFDNDNSYYREGNQKARFPINMGIVGYVASSGQTLNISDAYQDERFNPAVEADTGFRSRTILCMPIKNTQGHVIGVVQLTNKVDDTAFNRNDENLFEAFAIFCGMGINNTRMYEQVVKAMAKQRVAMEVLSYHSTATTEEVQRFKKCLVAPPQLTLNLADYRFNDALLDDDGTLKAVCRMFQDLNLLDQFSIPYDVFIRWLLTVKKNYRAVAYHNWRHAFNVTQTMYAMALSGCMKNVLSDLEILALLVGCLSHDLDHRGTNNQFQIKTMSALAELYSTSIMEWHHYEHCIRILTTKGTEILCNLNEDENKNVVSLLREAILATDLSLYFKHRDDFFLLVNSNSTAWSQSCNRSLLRSMMMTACDLAAITKPWLVQQKVAYLLADEFFEQGDIEKSQLHMKPIDMMDRDNTPKLPAMQLVFIDTICMPVYEAFAQLSDDYRTLLIGCRTNRERWAELAEGSSGKLECEEEERENEYKDDDDDDDDVHSTAV